MGSFFKTVTVACGKKMTMKYSSEMKSTNWYMIKQLQLPTYAGPEHISGLRVDTKNSTNKKMKHRETRERGKEVVNLFKFFHSNCCS